MAIRSAISYIINEEEDGFVAVDFDFINARDDDVHDLSSWEFIDQSVEDDDVYTCSSIGEKSDGLCEPEDTEVDFIGSVPSDVSSECPAERFTGEDVKSVTEYPPSTMFPEYLAERIVIHRQIASHHQIAAVDDDVMAYRSGGEKHYYSGEEEEEEEEEVDYDLDDELIPYYVNGKLGRERMRKLGKRSCPKMMKSKRLTYNYNKAGCFRGKHGLGLKHSLI